MTLEREVEVGLGALSCPLRMICRHRAEREVRRDVMRCDLRLPEDMSSVTRPLAQPDCRGGRAICVSSGCLCTLGGGCILDQRAGSAHSVVVGRALNCCLFSRCLPLSCMVLRWVGLSCRSLHCALAASLLFPRR